MRERRNTRDRATQHRMNMSCRMVSTSTLRDGSGIIFPFLSKEVALTYPLLPDRYPPPPPPDVSGRSPLPPARRVSRNHHTRRNQTIK